MIPVAANPYPIVMAHRGGAEEAVENSMAAFRRLREIGIGYLETDVHLSADGVVVVCHDPMLDRNYDGTGLVSGYTYEELLQFKNEAGEQMPRLADVLEEFPDLRLNIDAKNNEVVDPLLDVLRDHDAIGRCLIASFSEKRLERVREIGGPEVTTSLGTNAIVRLMLAAETVSNADSWHVPGPRHHARAAQVPSKSRGIRVVTPRFIATAHMAGLAVHVWTVNEREQMFELVNMGVDGLITDKPSLAIDVLKDMNLWSPEVNGS